MKKINFSANLVSKLFLSFFLIILFFVANRTMGICHFSSSFCTGFALRAQVAVSEHFCVDHG